jgi:multidrug efflux pump subunit AcrB
MGGWKKPLTGVFILPSKMKGRGHEPTRFAVVFHARLDRVLHLKYWVIGATVALFCSSPLLPKLVQQQFFRSSDRPRAACVASVVLPRQPTVQDTI